MKISCTPVSMSRSFKEGKIDLEGFIDFAAGMELDAVDLMDSLAYPWQYQNRKTEFQKIPKWLERANLKLAAVACGNNFAKANPDARMAETEKVINAVREAAELGAPAVRIFGGCHEDCGGEKGIQYADGFEYIVGCIERCLPEAEKNNVILGLENHGRLPGLSYEMKVIMEHFKSPYLKIVFDCANFLANNMNETENPLSAYEVLKEDIIHCHVKDWGKPFGEMSARRVAAYPLGKGGYVPVRQFLALLERDSFGGYCSLEYEAGWQVPETEGVRVSMEYLKQIGKTHKLFSRLQEDRK